MLLRLISLIFLAFISLPFAIGQDVEEVDTSTLPPAKPEFKPVKDMLFVVPVKTKRIDRKKRNEITKTVLRVVIGKPEFQVTIGRPKTIKFVSKVKVFRVELSVERQRNRKYKLEAQLVEQVPWVESEEEKKIRLAKEKKRGKRRKRKKKKEKSDEVKVKTMDKIVRRVRWKNIIPRKLIRSVDYAVRRIFDPEYKWTDPDKKVGLSAGEAGEGGEAGAGEGGAVEKAPDPTKQNDFAARIAAMKNAADSAFDKNKDKKNKKNKDDKKGKKAKDKEKKKSDSALAGGGQLKTKLKDPKPTPKGKASPTYTHKYLSSEILSRTITANDAGLVGIENDFRLVVVDYTGIIAFDKWSKKAITYSAGLGRLVSSSEYDFPIYKRVGMGIGSKFNFLNLFYAFSLKYESQYFVGIPDFGRGFQVAESMIAWGTFKANWVWELFTNFMLTFEFGKSLMAVSKYGERGESLGLTGDYTKYWFTAEIFKDVFLGVAYENMSLLGNGFGPITIQQKSVGLALHYFM